MGCALSPSVGPHTVDGSGEPRHAVGEVVNQLDGLRNDGVTQVNDGYEPGGISLILVAVAETIHWSRNHDTGLFLVPSLIHRNLEPPRRERRGGAPCPDHGQK